MYRNKSTQGAGYPAVKPFALANKLSSLILNQILDSNFDCLTIFAIVVSINMTYIVWVQTVPGISIKSRIDTNVEG